MYKREYSKKVYFLVSVPPISYYYYYLIRECDNQFLDFVFSVQM